MAVITLVRHAESTVNLPMAAPNVHTQAANLTERGVQQAHVLAAALPQVGTVFVSPYERARQTAAAYISHFASVAKNVDSSKNAQLSSKNAQSFSQLLVQEVPVQEFTLLGCNKCRGLPSIERSALVKAHIQASLADPWVVDDPQDSWCESLGGFCLRAHTQLRALLRHNQDCIVFSHGNFIKAMVWHAMTGTNHRHDYTPTPTSCWHMWAFLQSADMENCGTVSITTDRGKIVAVSPFSNPKIDVIDAIKC